MYVVFVSRDALQSVLDTLPWLRGHVSPQDQGVVRSLEVVISEALQSPDYEVGLRLNREQVDLMSLPGLWGMKRDDYINFGGQTKGARFLDG
ncbi:hypothetical protein [Nocardiopsis rhodophaea]|uniref:hypothetical protein n=1 Tax=Nocardiopsis rhodophaea TaxID=280238 RepID=UPI0031D59D9F